MQEFTPDSANPAVQPGTQTSSTGIGADLPASAVHTTEGPAGIGGWLILPTIGLVITPILTLIDLAQWLSFDADIREKVMGIAIFELAFVVYAIYCLICFFQTKKSVPGLMIGLYAVSIVFNLVLLTMTQDGIKDFIRSVFVAAIWIPYFLVSKRVKNTFVN